MEKVAAEM